MRTAETGPTTVLHRLIQEQLRWGKLADTRALLAIQQQALRGGGRPVTGSPGHSEEKLSRGDTRASTRQDPQGQEHRGSGVQPEKSQKNSFQLGGEELPSYEEAQHLMSHKEDMTCGGGHLISNKEDMRCGGGHLISNKEDMTCGGGHLISNKEDMTCGGGHLISNKEDMRCGGGHLISNKEDMRCGGGHLISNKEDMTCGGGHLISNKEDMRCGGGHLISNKEDMTCGGGHLISNKEDMRCGGGHLMSNKEDMRCGGGHLISNKEDMRCGGGHLISNKEDMRCGGGHLISNKEDMRCGGGHLISNKEDMTCGGGHLISNKEDMRCGGGHLISNKEDMTCGGGHLISNKEDMRCGGGHLMSNKEDMRCGGGHLISNKEDMKCGGGHLMSNKEDMRCGGGHLISNKEDMRCGGGHLMSNKEDMRCGGGHLMSHKEDMRCGGGHLMSHKEDMTCGGGHLMSHKEDMRCGGGHLMSHKEEMWCGGGHLDAKLEHSRSLSERLMQLSLQRSTQSQVLSLSSSHSSPQLCSSPGAPLDPRGPPPGYQQEAPPPSHRKAGVAMTTAAASGDALMMENIRLRQEVEMYAQKVARLDKMEEEMKKVSEAHQTLMKDSVKRQDLEKTMRKKLEAEMKRMHDFNRDLREQLWAATKQRAVKEEEHSDHKQHVFLKLLEQNEQQWREKERLEKKVQHLCLSAEDSRRARERLEVALLASHARNRLLGEELQRKRAYVEKVERLQGSLAQLQAACEKREELELRLRTRLEEELRSLRGQQNRTSGLRAAEPESCLWRQQLGEPEGRILVLEDDISSWEHKYLQESTIRYFAVDPAAAHRDTTTTTISKSPPLSPDSSSKEDLPVTCLTQQEVQNRMRALHVQLLEKDSMIRVLQQRSRRDQGVLRPARSVPSISAAGGASTDTKGKSLSDDQTGVAGLRHRSPQECDVAPPLETTPTGEVTSTGRRDEDVVDMVDMVDMEDMVEILI
ncbi:angiomotin-like 2a [Nerophis ophidion]|uniref:angiomotin-like 2a n=1 Tax=Nerophis ophidion TaxID=159077 RepID=UPI002AE04666|nr:angiomotin-like 2a [Nerophis ophidion]